MLLPQVGDVVERASRDGFFRVREIEEYIIFDGYGSGDYHFAKKDGIREDFLADIRILQRSGKTFFTPEIEITE